MESLQELCDQFLLQPPGDDGYFDFPHQLLRDAIYRSVRIGDRRRYHARAGEFGARLIGQSDIHASAHFERAGMHREAYEAALSGAREAASVSLHREAHELYRRVVSNMPADIGASERGAILEAAQTEAIAIVETASASEFGRQAAIAYRSAGESTNAIRVIMASETMTRRDGRPASEWMGAVVALRRELEAEPASPEADELRADMSWVLAIGHIDGRDMAAAREALAETRRLGVILDDREWSELADWKLGLIEVLEGRAAGGLKRMAEVARMAEISGLESMGVTAYRDTAVTAAMAMDYQIATQMLDAGLKYTDSVQQSYCSHLMAATTGLVAWAEGRWSDAAKEASHAMADPGSRRGEELARWSHAFVLMGRGDLTSAEDELAKGLTFGQSAQAIEYVLAPLWGLAEVALQAGDPARAIEHCEDALRRSLVEAERLQFVPFVVTGVRAFLAAARPAEAASWLDACRDRLEDTPEVASAALEHARGLLATSDGATGVARNALEAAILGWDAKPRVWEGTWARLDLANCLVRAGRYADALALTVEVRETASRLDAPALVDRAEELARMARGRVSTEEPWRPLTAREYAVAQLIAEGYTNAEIADELGIASKTASSHVEHILAKLGVARRAEIAAWTTTVAQSVAMAR